MLPLEVRKTIYMSLGQSYLQWGSLITGTTKQANLTKIEATQNKMVRNLANVKYNSHSLPLYHKIKLLKATDLLFYNQVLFCYKFRMGDLPATFNKNFIYSFENGERERREDSYNFAVPKQGPNQKFPLGEAIKAWNRLGIFYKSCFTYKEFKWELKDYLLAKYSGFNCSKAVCHACDSLY